MARSTASARGCSWEVLRLGGYAREYFVSQTPELTQMADVVIDVGAFSKSSMTSTAHAVA